LQEINQSYATFVENRAELLGKQENGLNVKTSPSPLEAPH